MEYGAGWNILDTLFEVSSNLSNKATLTLVIERAAVGLAAFNVIPLIVIVILNITVIIIDVINDARVYISSFCLLCHLMFMQTMNDHIPVNGTDAPGVLIFLRTSLVLCAISIAMAFIMKYLRRTKHETPAYILKFNEFFIKDSRKNLIWPKWKAEVGEQEHINKTLEEWTVFANVLNSLNLVIYSVLYSILYIVYMPRPVHLLI